MTNYEGRQEDLKIRLNKYLSKITGQKKDYYQDLAPADLAELKMVLSEVNNIFTLKLTLTATEWICKNFGLSQKVKTEILKKIDSVKPNTNGYDIIIDEPKIVAEVKCVFPSNNGDKYLAAQRNGILDDAIKLINGKRPLSSTSDYFKFLFIIDVGERTDLAIDRLLKPSKGRSDKDFRKNRHKIKAQIALLNSNDFSELSTNKVYIKTLKISD